MKFYILLMLSMLSHSIGAVSLVRSEQSPAFSPGSKASLEQARNGAYTFLEDWEEMGDQKRGESFRVEKGEKVGKGGRAPSRGVSIEFGGDKHTMTQLTPAMRAGCPDCSKEYLVRPEGVKSLACTGSECTDCVDRTKCFHGKTENGWGYLVADIPAGSTLKYYEAEVWARCPKLAKAAQWWFELIKVVNGRLELYAGKKKTPLSGTAWTRIVINRDKVRVRALFYPSNRAHASYAKVWLEAYEADKGAEVCMAVKDCLDILGDGSAASFKLRNDNQMQWKCLRREHRGMERRVRRKCEQWRRCLKKNHKEKEIRSLLGAAMQTNDGRNGLIQGSSSTNDTRLATEASFCVDPSVDDPESWDCDCVEGMIKKCEAEGMAQDLETCMNSLMCKSAKVCSGWKRTHCAGASLLQERRQASTKVAGRDLDHLDGTMQGKCAE